VDCGGSCAPCPAGDACNVNADCQTGYCAGGTCAAAPCVTFRRDLGSAVQNQTILALTPDSNFGASPLMQAGIQRGTEQYALVRFGIGAIPASARVTSAEVKLRENWTNGPGMTINVHRITTAWSEPTVTYNNFGNAFDASIATSFLSGDGTTLDTFALPTSLVQAWVSGTAPNDGFLLETQTGRIDFNTSEAGGGAGSEPELDVCYIPGG
jgi:hypothetical protein